MLTSVNSWHMMWRKWIAAALLWTLLMQEVTSISDLASTLSLRKCHCTKYQAWDGTKCHDNNTTLPIYNKDFELQMNEINTEQYSINFPTSMVENVTVMELECPKDLYYTTIIYDIMLLPDGRLLFLNTMDVYTNDVFCIEHSLENGRAYFDAHVCLPLPAVPRCCPVNHLLNQYGSCHPQKGLQAPPLQLGSRMVSWDRVGGNMVTLTCGKHEFYHHVALGPGKAQLDDKQPTATLNWNPSFWVSSQTWTDRYCVALQEMETGELQYVAQICFKDYDRHHQHQCNNSVCIRKCCPQDTLLYNAICIQAKNEEVWRPSQIPGQAINDEWQTVIGEPGCKSHPYFEEMHLLPNGFLQTSPDKPPVPPSHYCLDNLLVDNDNITNFAILCFPPENTACAWRDTVIKVMLGMSCVFLIATLMVYLGVAELRDHTYGRCLISLVIAMLTAYISLMCNSPDTMDSRALCFFRAFINHLSALAVFFWLNVMCFDMWKILRGSTMQHHSRKMFLGYSFYAWGCPTVVSTITLVLDIMAPENIILPEFNAGTCWFKEDRAYWAYFSSFILVLVLVNIGFFIHVAVSLYQKMKLRTRTFDTNSSRTNKTTKNKQQVWLFAKLFVVMGVVWIADALSALSHRKTCSYWVFTDIINGLQGVFIFIVAVCNKDNLMKVKNAWRPRVQSMRTTLSSFPGQSSRRSTQNTLSVDDLDASRKTSITSLQLKISQASNILFPSSSKKTATLNPADSSQENSNVSIKEVIPLSSMRE